MNVDRFSKKVKSLLIPGNTAAERKCSIVHIQLTRDLVGDSGCSTSALRNVLISGNLTGCPLESKYMYMYSPLPCSVM